MNRTPVRIEHRWKLYKLAADESGQERNQGGQGERDCAEEAKVFPVRDEQRGNACAESKRETQIVKIGERDIAKDPGHLRKSPLAEVRRVLSIVGRDPAHAPTR